MSGSKISGVVFLDQNADGTDESGDTSLAGVTVTLFSSAGIQINSAQTDTTGAYSFTSLAPGSYYIIVTPPTGASFSPAGTSASLPNSAVNSAGKSPTITVGTADAVTENAGVYAPVSLSGTVFTDSNDDGMVDGTDKGLAGVTVQLLNAAGQATGATQTTDSNGNYTFATLVPGTYSVHVVMPSSEPTGAVFSPYGSNTPPQPTGGSSTSQTNLLVNGSFDNGLTQTGSFTTAQGLAGWTVSTSTTAMPYGSGPGNGPEIAWTNGTNAVAIDPTGNVNPYAGIVSPDNADPAASPYGAGGSGYHAAFFVDDGAIETLSQTVTLTAGQTYEVGFDLDETTPGQNNPGYFQLTASIGGQTIVTASSTSGTKLTPGTWTHFADLYTPTVSGPVTLTFAYASGVVGSLLTSKDVLVDDVYVTAGQVTPNLTTTSEVNATGNTAQVTLTSGQTVGDESAGIYLPPATITGNVFTDLNADGAKESGDNGVAGQTVNLVSGGTIVNTTTTDSSGNYSFTNQAAGTYTVQLQLPSGSTAKYSPVGTSTTLTDSTVSSSGAQTVTVANGGTAVVNAGLYSYGAVKGTVFNDVNANGTQDSGDSGLAGQTVQLISNSGGTLATTTTGANGSYSFSNVTPGTDTVKVIGASGEIFSTPSASVVNVTSAATSVFNAGEFAPAQITGTVYNDANADGTKQTGEAGIAGQTVSLISSSGGTLATTTTGANGSYSFTGVAPGTDTVKVTPLTGDVFSTPSSTVLSVAEGGSYVFNAGEYAPTGTVNGTVFIDNNADGLLDGADAGLGGQTVTLVTSTGTLTTTTASNGSYSFTGVTPGNDTVTFAPASGNTLTTPASVAVAVTSGATATANTGEYAPSTISGTVYTDNNADGALDGADAGLGGQTVTLVTQTGTLTTTTASNGSYSFTGVAPGADTVKFAAASGSTLSTPASVAVTTTSGSNTTGVNAGEYAPSTISGTVFVDANGNGKLDGGDTGFGGQTVMLVTQAGTLTTTTASNGSYSFTGVAPGADTVKFTAASGDTLTTAGSVAVTTSSGSNTTGVNAGEDAPSTISGTVYTDNNADGALDGADAGLGGQTVLLVTQAGTITTTTAANGSYSFTGVAPGADTVKFAAAPGNTLTTPASVAVTATSGSNTTGVNAGEYAPSTISGTVYTDNNADGALDGSDAGLGGQTVLLVTQTGTLTTTTASNGSYSFTGVAPGADTVKFAAAPGNTLTTPASVAVTASSGSNTTGVNAGEYAPSTISGTVFNDNNADGMLDGADAGLGGQTVLLVTQTGTIATTTAANGSYTFTGLAPGADTVKFVPPEANTLTTAGSVAVTTTSGSNTTGVNAGEYAPSTISGTVFIDNNADGKLDGADAGLGGQTVLLVTQTGTLTTTTASNGSYSFTGVAPGSDTVKFTAAAGDSLTTAASVPVTVTSGSMTTVNAGEDAPSTISGKVFTDNNADGAIDGADAGLGGQTVTLLTQAGTTLTTTTASNGSYSFTGVAPGADTVSFTVAPGDTLTTPGSVAVTVTSGSATTGVNAGEYAPSTISGTVYTDNNADGALDGADAGLGGQTVLLVTQTGTLTTTTASNGSYSFTGVAPGADTVKFAAAPGNTLTTAGSVAVTTSSGSNTTGVNAGEYAPSTISGTVFIDNNADGKLDGADAGLGGQTVLLVTQTGTLTTTTASNGSYSFTGVAPGSDTVKFAAAPGDTLSTAASVPVTVSSGSSSTVNAGEYAPGTINGTVFTDNNGDGKLDGADAGLGGQTVTLVTQTGTLTTTTASNGSYSFTGVAPGSDTVKFTAASGDTLTTAASVPVTVSSGSTSTVNAGEYAGSAISGTVFTDNNGNGTQDGNDPGLAGQTVTLVTQSGTITTTTAADGSYSFTGVAPGNDTVSFTATTGDTLTTPGLVAVTVSSGSSTTVNAGEDAPSTISGTVYTDNNADGKLDGADAGLGGQTVLLVTQTGTITTTTASNGSYSFTGVAPGTDTVKFAAAPGNTLTTPASVSVTATSGSATTGVNAGEYAPSTISGTVFTDNNADGLIDGSDAGLGGQTVLLVTQTGTLTTTTASNGSYSFTGVAPGADTVKFAAAAGDTLTTPASVAVTTTSGSNTTGVNAGEYAPSTISGTVFTDNNGDGLIDGSDAGLGGQTVLLVTQTGTLTTTTAANGSYSFTGVAPGSDTVKFTAAMGDTLTTAASVPVTVTSGSSSTVNAGEYAGSAITGIVYTDTNGDSLLDGPDAGLGGQTVTLVTQTGTLTTTTASDGSYTFTGVAPGADTVTFTAAPGDTLTTPASVAVTVSSGSTSTANAGEYAPSTISGTVFIDNNADGALDGSDAGLGGQTVLLVTQTGTLTTTTASDGSYSFTGVAPGSDTVMFAAAAGNTLTTSSSVAVTPTSGSNTTGVNAGEYAPSTISGTVFTDTNGNGQLDAGDTGLGGQTVTLVTQAGIITTTTAADGSYSFTGVAPGSDTVTFTATPGDSLTTLASVPVTVSSGSASTVNAGEDAPSTISGTVFTDTNGDGLLDGPDAGLGGQTVTLVGPTGAVSITTTAADGSYSFSGIAPGSDTLTFTPAPGNTLTTPTSVPVTVTSGSANTVNAGEYAPSTIGGTVFTDTNGDGLLDGPDAGLGGQTVTLTTPTGTVTTTTASDGSYSFSGIAPGSDTVTFAPAPGDTLSTSATVPVTVTSGSGTSGVNAGEYAPSTISGIVFTDNNADGSLDGSLDGSDAGLGGQTVTLTGPAGTVTTTTAADGSYSFSGVAPGSDTVTFAAAPGNTLTTAATVPVTVISGSATSGVNAGEYAPGTIGGTVFTDTNGDGKLDGPDGGLGGQTVTLTTPTGTLTTTTAADGSYSFSGVAPGNDTVTFTPAPGSTLTTPASVPVTVSSGSGSTVNAGEYAPSTISGTVFTDSNADGALDGSDAGLGGQTVILTGPTGATTTTTTAANGTYSFTGVAPGTDTIQVVPAAGNSFSPAGTLAGATDSNVSATGGATVTVTSGSSTQVNAGVYAPATVAVQVYADANADGSLDNGEVGVGGVPVQLLNAAGTTVLETGVTAANGTVRFTGLQPGSYEVAITTPSGEAVTQLTNVGTPLSVSAGTTTNAVEGIYAPPPGRIDGHVFVNTACTGLYQVGDANVAGVTVELLYGSGTPFLQNGTILTTKTDANGDYSFTNIAAGTYEEKFILPNGLSFTTQRVGSDNTINSAASQTTGATDAFTVGGGADVTTENAGVYLNGNSVANPAVVAAGTAESFNTGGNLIVGAGNDNIHTNAGNNAIIIGSQGSDGGNIVETGPGTDIVYSCSSLNAQALGSGTNPASNLGFADYLFGGSGNNDLQGGAGSDYLMGGPGYNLIAGGSGAAEIIAGSNSLGIGSVARDGTGAITGWTVNNEIRPGNGTSTLIYQKGDGVMLLDTFVPGTDSLTIYGYPAGTTGTYTTANGHTVLDLGGNDAIVFNNVYTPSTGGIAFSTSTAPLLVLNFDANGMPYFSAPDASVTTAGQAQVLTTSAPAGTTETVTGAGGAPLTVNFATQALAAQAQSQLSTISAAIALGTAVAETVTGGSLPTLPAGVAGLAEIDGTGVVALTAGYTTAIDSASGPVTISAAVGGNHLIVASGSGALTYDGATGADTVYAGSGDALAFGGGTSMDFFGGTGAATIIGGAAGNTVVGGAGSQLIFGSSSLNYTGGAGAATIIGGGNGNTVTGGDGNLLVFASSGMTYQGGSGEATVIGGGGPLNANLGAGGGVAYGSPGGGNTLSTGSGTSILVGGGSGDLLTATGSGNDTLVAGGGNETLNGAANSGQLVLFGGPGSDVMTGGSGSNLFIAESGNATLTAGGTANSFVFIDTPGTTRTDVISNFNPSHDAIGLFGYGAEPGADSAALASQTVVGGNTVVKLTDGTQIVFTGAPTLHSYNFF